ncbi:TadE/TadG family type IV pilus assembly protein [Anaeromyxobacter terrae]|uniref:TadE/TadG family type IV pilus assembly protein n=1 Tax=Anaeromyxobacter terrae TaxID=2925406 RepID=UPI001F5A7FA8|nr:TadE family protein [Anaeromyxobacter sp. SG22]
MTASRSRSERASGAAAVEFALVLPVLMLLCLGAIEWGFHFFQREIIVNAAREGARAGSIADTDAAGVAVARAREYLSVAGINAATCTIDIPEVVTSVRVAVDCQGGSFTLLFNDLMPARIVATAEMRR